MSSAKKSAQRFYGPSSTGFTGIFGPTADGADTWTVDLNPGGPNPANPATRGANLRLVGNEATGGNVGCATLASGNVASAKVLLNARLSAGGLASIMTLTGDYVDIAGAGTVPSTNPAASAVRLYSDAGVLKYRQSDGTVKTITTT